MAKRSAKKKARTSKRRGKSPSTQAGEFVREEIELIRDGKHGVANAKQAIAIGLAKAKRAGVKVGDNPKRAKAKKKTKAKSSSTESSAKRSRAAIEALKKNPRAGASHRALSRQAKARAKKRRTRMGR